MIDFHAHILPNMDDGAANMAESLGMLRRSFLQGVDLVVSTPHFYPDREYPNHFRKRRDNAFQRLQDAILLSADVFPRIVPGAEVMYFPGISQTEEIPSLMIGSSRSILIELPMEKVSKQVLDELSDLEKNFNCRPVIAHVDRYMYYLHDPTLIHRLRERGLVVQVNGEYFLNPKTGKMAAKNLKNGLIQLIGSDCHNLVTRPPNLDLVRKQAKAMGVEAEFLALHQNAVNLLLGKEGRL